MQKYCINDNEQVPYFFLIVIFICIVDIVIIFFLWFGNQKVFFRDLYPNISFFNEIDDKYDIPTRDAKVRSNNIFIEDIQYYFLSNMRILFDSFVVFYKFLFSLSLDTVEKKIYDSKSYLINKFMHQSFDSFSPSLVSKTITVVELKLDTSQGFYVVQLGALRNFQKVFEIVARLKSYSYPVFISPENPKSGDIVRIFVGPYPSKENLEFVLEDLYRLSFLFGEIFFYQDIKK